MVAAFLLLLLCGTDPVYEPLSDTVDMVEVNHFYNEHGGLIFDQIIYWEWSVLDEKFNVVDWRLLKDCREVLTQKEKRAQQDQQEIVGIKDGFAQRAPVIPKFLGSPMIPTLQPNGKYRARWIDGHYTREVWCLSVRETWTQFDPELLDRDFLPKDQRRLLTAIPKQKTYWVSGFITRLLRGK